MEQVRQMRMYVDGVWKDSVSGQTREIIDPATEQVIALVPEGTAGDVEAAVVAARRAFASEEWRGLHGQGREKLLFTLANLIRENLDELVRLETLNTGKPLAEAEWDILDAANCFEYYGGMATKINGQTIDVPADALTYTVHEPIGVIGLIIPWNFPMQIAAWKMAPALAAGNTVVVKPSELTPLTTLELAKLCEKAGFPSGVVNVVTGTGAVVGRTLVQHPLVGKISFTGGTVTGQEIMITAAKDMKRLTLELGGKSANVVFADADIERAVEGVMFGIFLNQGQVCSAGSRLLIEEKVKDAFLKRLVERAGQIKIGSGLLPDTKMGPLISKEHLAKVQRYIAKAVEEGGKLLCGGKRPEHVGPLGYYLEPTIFDEVSPDMTIFGEEVFGPVLAVTTFATEHEAIELCNSSEYGLAAGVWTKDLERGIRCTRAIQSGVVWVNTYNSIFPQAPWGGVKKSGFGKELGTYGLEPFLEVKQVYIDLTGQSIGWY